MEKFTGYALNEITSYYLNILLNIPIKIVTFHFLHPNNFLFNLIFSLQ